MSVDLSFDLTTFATAFAVIFLAELPDKTMFASLAMGTRMRAPWVWLGTSSAFLVHVTVAVAAGSAFSLLPMPLVHGVAAVLFAFGAYTLLRGGKDEGAAAGGGAGRGRRVTGFPRTYVTAFTVVFISEWGDLTQLTTANLAATRGPLPVALGALLALMSVSALALVAGRFIADRVPLRVVQRAGGAVMAVLAVWSLVEAFC